MASQEYQESRASCQGQQCKQPQPQVIDLPVVLPDLRIYSRYGAVVIVGAVNAHGALPAALRSFTARGRNRSYCLYGGQYRQLRYTQKSFRRE